MIIGKDKTEAITSIHIGEESARLYFNNRSHKDVPIDLFILWSRSLSEKHVRLVGELDFNWATKYTSEKEWRRVLNMASKQRYDFMTPWNAVENIMVKQGYNNFKNIKVEDVPVLSFDIETTGLNPHAANAKVLLISNTYRDGKGNITRRLFSYDDYVSDSDMIKEWCTYVRELNPAFIMGHNIYGFDIPYLYARNDDELKLGVEGQKIIVGKRSREFRKDGSQTYSYKNVIIAGRELVDTFFLAIKYDIGRKYPGYGLKSIIEFEGLTVENREFYDASTIHKNYRNKVEWEKIKTYAEHDADDALALYDLMIPSFFYYAQHIPKPFQEVINTATGSQLNSLMVRSYVELGHSIPRATKAEHFAGGISFGLPGVYKNVLSLDFKALYPSIMLQYNIHDQDKDPRGHVPQLLRTFVETRNKYKAMYKETGDAKYDAMQQAAKVAANSFFGFLGAPGLNFNSPKSAGSITSRARDLLEIVCVGATDKKLMDWKNG